MIDVHCIYYILLVFKKCRSLCIFLIYIYIYIYIYFFFLIYIKRVPHVLFLGSSCLLSNTRIFVSSVSCVLVSCDLAYRVKELVKSFPTTLVSRKKTSGCKSYKGLKFRQLWLKWEKMVILGKICNFYKRIGSPWDSTP